MIICSAISDAGINTVICLAVVFAVLIFISFLISLFKYIPKLEAALSKKDKKTELAENAVVNTVSQRLRKRKKSFQMTLSLWLLSQQLSQLQPELRQTDS